MFACLFKQNEALREWRNLVNGLEPVRVQVFSDKPAFQELHWEALKDPLESLAFCRYMTLLAGYYTTLMKSKEAGQRQMGFELFRQDRENLYKALHRVLDREGDFYSLYFIFAQFYHQQPLYQEAIDFMAAVVRKLDRYAQKGTDFLENYAYVVGNLGNNFQQVKNFSEAKKNLTRALELLRQAGKRQETAAVYHQLGYVAQEERDWSEARAHYREALKIFQEFNDRYSQADTYFTLGSHRRPGRKRRNQNPGAETAVR